MHKQPSDHEARITELENRLAFQDQTIEELHEVIYRQQGQLDGLTAELARLHRLLRESLPEADGAEGS